MTGFVVAEVEVLLLPPSKEDLKGADLK